MKLTKPHVAYLTAEELTLALVEFIARRDRLEISGNVDATVERLLQVENDKVKPHDGPTKVTISPTKAEP